LCLSILNHFRQMLVVRNTHTSKCRNEDITVTVRSAVLYMSTMGSCAVVPRANEPHTNLCMLYTAWFLMFKHWFCWKCQYKKYINQHNNNIGLYHAMYSRYMFMKCKWWMTYGQGRFISNIGPGQSSALRIQLLTSLLLKL
jgi:hypothetical protein